MKLVRIKQNHKSNVESELQIFIIYFLKQNLDLKIDFRSFISYLFWVGKNNNLLQITIPKIYII